MLKRMQQKKVIAAREMLTVIGPHLPIHNLFRLDMFLRDMPGSIKPFDPKVKDDKFYMVVPYHNTFSAIITFFADFESANPIRIQLDFSSNLNLLSFTFSPNLYRYVKSLSRNYPNVIGLKTQKSIRSK